MQLVLAYMKHEYALDPKFFICNHSICTLSSLACMSAASLVRIDVSFICMVISFEVFLNAATPFEASEFLKKYEKEFFRVVNAKHSLLKLRRLGVISPGVMTNIEKANNDDDAKEILYDHLSSNANAATLREWCDVAIEANGFPKMQELGKKMKEALPCAQGGQLELCVCKGNCVICGGGLYACMYVYVCVTTLCAWLLSLNRNLGQR